MYQKDIIKHKEAQLTVLAGKIRAKITNVVATAELDQRIDATKFNHYTWGIYDLELYSGRCGYIKDETMGGRVTVFLSGKMISTGAKSIRNARKQLARAMELMVKAKLAKPIKLRPIIRNIVALIDLKHILDINSLSVRLPKSIFEPDQFPGLIHKTSIGPTLLIFSSGKVVVAGAKSENEVEEIASMLTEIIRGY